MSTEDDAILQGVYRDFSDAAIEANHGHFSASLERAINEIHIAAQHLNAIRHERERRGYPPPAVAAPQEQP